MTQVQNEENLTKITQSANGITIIGSGDVSSGMRTGYLLGETAMYEQIVFDLIDKKLLTREIRDAIHDTYQNAIRREVSR